MTPDHYDTSNRLTEIDEPNGTTVTFAYDANGQHIKKTTQTGGSNPTMTVVNDTYQNGRLAYQTNLGGTVLATFTYDPSGVPESVVVGSDPVNGPRYYYVYNGHGDVVALTDASGNVVASYAYDVWGNLTSSSENIPNANGWTNPYRYDGKDGARYDVETGLYWLTTRAYDPTLGRFLQRDPLGRFPLFFWNQPYVYAGNNPLINVDPSGQRFADEDILSQETAQQQIAETRRTQQVMRMYTTNSQNLDCDYPSRAEYATCYGDWESKQYAKRANHLRSTVQWFNWLFVGGYALDLLADVAVFLAITSAEQALEAGLDLVLTLLLMFSYLPAALTGIEGSDGDAGFQWATGAAHATLALIRGTLALLHKLGFLAEAAADGAVIALKAWATGLPGVIQTIIKIAAGPVVNNLLSAGGHVVLAMAYAMQSDYTHQMSEDIGVWCSENRGVCSPPPAVP